MEEILASIRAIIADDRDGGAASSESARRPAAPSEPRIVYSNDAPARTIGESAPDAHSEAVDEPPSVEPAPRAAREAPSPPVVVWARPSIEPSADPPMVAEVALATESEPAPSSEPPLLSEDADRAVAASFEALSASVALQSAELVERLTREMLRPMVKTWLDEHLPSMVERLVRAEIQRVARGGR